MMTRSVATIQFLAVRHDELSKGFKASENNVTMLTA